MVLHYCNEILQKYKKIHIYANLILALKAVNDKIIDTKVKQKLTITQRIIFY